MARSEQSQYRKTQRMLEHTHGGFAGKSIIEKLIDQLDKAMEKYLDFKADPDRLMSERMARGEVRGLARAIGMMQNPYYPTRDIKQIEKVSAARVKEKRNAAEQAPAQEERE